MDHPSTTMGDVPELRFCRLCGGALPAYVPGSGRARVTHYPACPDAADPLEPARAFAAGVPVRLLVADPFNSTPVTAPIEPSAVHDPSGPGPIEAKLIADLEHVVSTNPLAGTLSMVALRCARTADRAPAENLKEVLAAVKELRAIMAEIVKTHAGEDDSDADATPVGSSAPAVVHTTAY